MNNATTQSSSSVPRERLESVTTFVQDLHKFFQEGLKKGFSWIYKDSPRDSTGGASGEARPNQNASKKVGCPAKLTNHRPGTIEDVQHLPCPEDLTAEIAEELQKNYPAAKIREYLQEKHADEPATSRAANIHAGDKNNLKYKLTMQQIRREQDDLISGLGLVVVREQWTGSGIPVAYLFTNDHSAEPLKEWLYELRDRRLIPAKITIDVSLSEGNALEHVFVKVSGADSDSGTVRKHLCFDLHGLMYEEDPVQFDQRLEQFQSKWASHRGFGTTSSGSGSITASMFTGHAATNQAFHAVERDMQWNIPTRTVNIGRMSPQEQLFRAQEIKAGQFPAARLESAVVKINDASFKVASFQEGNVDARYQIQADGLHLSHCMCDAFRSNGRACKHLFLVARLHGEYHVRPPLPSFNRQDLPDIPATQIPPTVVPPTVFLKSSMWPA
ncbi:hypothetical protein VTP01DRAFT_3520 [Rhizomucor pusillus]|uniref:uncharacterized protein n=1 Tax=Rhizomucor pusillus TaxID=4840 RepID=UPI003744A570